jgi:hypothetical protein
MNPICKLKTKSGVYSTNGFKPFRRWGFICQVEGCDVKYVISSYHKSTRKNAKDLLYLHMKKAHGGLEA